MNFAATALLDAKLAARVADHFTTLSQVCGHFARNDFQVTKLVIPL